jgi:hypothetical protein
MAGALRAIAAEEPPSAPRAAAAMTRDLHALIEAQRRVLLERDFLRGRMDRVRSLTKMPVLGHAYRAWQRPSVQRVAGPAVAKLRRRLRGA